MSRLDDLVRETLASHESEAPSDSTLLADVRARSARRRSRARWTTGAAAAAVVAVIATLTQVHPFGSRGPAGLPPAAGPQQARVFPLPSDGWQPDDPAMAALAMGPFHAARLENGEVCAWLGARFRPMLWPGGYRVRLHPVQLIGPQGQVIANEGDILSSGGGEIPANGDTRCAKAGQPVWLAQGVPQRAPGTMPSGQGILTGHLYVDGGPAPGTQRGVRGTIILQGQHGEHRVTVGPDGSYHVQLPIGTYTVTGDSPRYNYGKSICSVDHQVTVTRGQSASADVVCQMR
jgi:hypothetical protein